MKKQLFGPLLVAGGLLLSACGSTATVSPVPSALKGDSAAQVVALTKATTLAQGSVRLTENVSERTATESLTTNQVNDAGVKIGQVVFADGSGTTAATSQVRLVNNVIYVNDSASMIQSQFGKADAKLAGKWISIPSSVADFERFSGVILLGSLVDTSFPLGPYKFGTTTTFDGQKAFTVVGVPNTPSQEVHGTGTLYLSTTSPYLPLGVQFKATYEGEKATYTSTFSHWGEMTPATAPSSSVPLQSTPLS